MAITHTHTTIQRHVWHATGLAVSASGRRGTRCTIDEIEITVEFLRASAPEEGPPKPRDPVVHFRSEKIRVRAHTRISGSRWSTGGWLPLANLCNISVEGFATIRDAFDATGYGAVADWLDNAETQLTAPYRRRLKKGDSAGDAK